MRASVSHLGVTGRIIPHVMLLGPLKARLERVYIEIARVGRNSEAYCAELTKYQVLLFACHLIAA